MRICSSCNQTLIVPGCSCGNFKVWHEHHGPERPAEDFVAIKARTVKSAGTKFLRRDEALGVEEEVRKYYVQSPSLAIKLCAFKIEIKHKISLIMAVDV